jgi:hypothetical protein
MDNPPKLPKLLEQAIQNAALSADYAKRIAAARMFLDEIGFYGAAPLRPRKQRRRSRNKRKR